MERHCAANQTVIQLEKTPTANTDTGAVPRWYDTTAHYQTYVIGQTFKQLHDKYTYHIFGSIFDAIFVGAKSAYVIMCFPPFGHQPATGNMYFERGEVVTLARHA